MKTQTLEVTGMTCGGCTANVKRALDALPGVDAVAVSLKDGRAEVRYDENQVDVKAMRDALRGAGYDLATEAAPAAPRRGGCCS